MTNKNNNQIRGTTNLSIEQLKKEGSATNPDHITDQDDLNEIRAADDLDEPDPEEGQPDNSTNDHDQANMQIDDLNKFNNEDSSI